MRVALGNDHRGVSAKQRVAAVLTGLGHEVVDLGAGGSAGVDYPDYAIPVAEAVAAGKAEIGVTFISEIVPIKGAKLAGPLPPALQGYIGYAAAIPKASTDPTAARAFVNALVSRAMAARWTDAGFEAPK